jgi:DNA-binding response OmpR family regulator
MTKEKLTVLVVEDDEGLIELLTEILHDSEYNCISYSFGNEAINWLARNHPFLMILDYGLPDMNGREFVLTLKEKAIEIPPFIVSTGQGDERIAVG